MSRHKWAQEDIIKILKLSREGLTCDQIAKRYDSTRGSISGLINRERRKRREKVFGK